MISDEEKALRIKCPSCKGKKDYRSKGCRNCLSKNRYNTFQESRQINNQNKKYVKDELNEGEKDD